MQNSIDVQSIKRLLHINWEPTADPIHGINSIMQMNKLASHKHDLSLIVKTTQLIKAFGQPHYIHKRITDQLFCDRSLHYTDHIYTLKADNGGTCFLVHSKRHILYKNLPDIVKQKKNREHYLVYIDQKERLDEVVRILRSMGIVSAISFGPTIQRVRKTGNNRLSPYTKSKLSRYTGASLSLHQSASFLSSSGAERKRLLSDILDLPTMDDLKTSITAKTTNK